jgi:hypothetical protein
MIAENGQSVLIAEARVARQEELISLLRARGGDIVDAQSMLAGLRYSVKVLKQQHERQRRLGAATRSEHRRRTLPT